MKRQIILDFGSGNTCQNNIVTVRKMINSLQRLKLDKLPGEIIIKWQLFEQAGNNMPLMEEVFIYAYKYAKTLNFKTTASIFDKKSLDFLLEFDIPFIKIANNIESYKMSKLVPHDVKKYISWGASSGYVKMTNNDEILFCVSEYPANIHQYKALNIHHCDNISDHTTNFDLYNEYSPKIVEWHYKLPESTGLDAGEFAKTWKDLEQLYG